MNILKIIGTKRRPVNLFFMELIIALLFFSISGAVILQVFAAADKRSRLSAEKENAMICAQSIAEVYSESGNAAKALKAVFSENVNFNQNNGIYTLPLDDRCRAATDGKVLMEMAEKCEKTPSGEMSHLTISFSADNEELYSLVCSAYKPAGGASDA